MASNRQSKAAKENIKKAQRAARSEHTLANLPESTRRDLGKQGARARARHGAEGHALEDRSRQQLYDVARERGISGRSKMGKWELIDAIRKHG
jgi:hypothetical protein